MNTAIVLITIKINQETPEINQTRPIASVTAVRYYTCHITFINAGHRG